MSNRREVTRSREAQGRLYHGSGKVASIAGSGKVTSIAGSGKVASIAGSGKVASIAGSSLRLGFAPGCEAWLRLAGAGAFEKEVGLCPWFGLWPPSGRARTRGVAPRIFIYVTGEA